MDYHKRSHSWNAWDLYQANQLEIKLNKNSTQAFYFGLKLWPQLEINETSNFFSNKLILEYSWRYLFTIQELIYFYNIDVNSYLTECLEEIQAKFACLSKFSLVLA